MIGPSGPMLPLVALIWPLLLGLVALLPPVRAHALRLLPLAPLPAIGLAFLGGQGVTVVPDVLLGVTLGAGRPAMLLLTLTACLWFAAAVHAQKSMKGTANPAVFSSFWCLTLAGNLGVFLAQDVATFYVAFAAVSLSAYFLVVHEATAEALRAGRLYIVLALVGEVCLLVAFLIGASAADSLMIGQIRLALADAPLGTFAVALLVAGFGIKAGLMPLHVWLPLAHPAAPTPASAVLSGAIVKAGIVGLMLFLPVASDITTIVIALGFATAFGGALAGLRVRQPKAILAYSTISQMGLVIALVAAATRSPGGDMAYAAYYGFHHGLAKGALFLGVALVAGSRGRWRSGGLVLLAAVALSVAGAPLTGGGLAKAAAKTGLGAWETFALTLSAATTTLVLGWFLVRLAASPTKHAEDDAEAEGARHPHPLIAGPVVALALAAVVSPWWLWSAWSGLPADYPMRLATLWSAAWPVALGMAAIAAMARANWPAGTLEAADPLRAARAAGRRLAPLKRVPGSLATMRAAIADRSTAAVRRAGTVAAKGAETLEGALLQWRISGLAIVVSVLAIAILAAR
ncbi:complex I subunit 5 family protein [Blastomonas sp.]|uniref:complex I subunit 5 family protein n=1 Tax=Blastomonas sp. TaxID=1909299 RepID=UPI00261BB73A|nr:complex I subunit 5 family protein [Blastomonas sp.]MDM7955784.1 complex I subunit 5 family protein [Blastomonas sp.]